MSLNQELSKPDDRENEEVTKRLVKLDLETQKLALEIRSLARQLSKRGFALELLKSAGVLAALLGVGVTLYIGFGQVRNSEQNRVAERFDKALTRLASDKPNERITGVSALRLFLSERDSSLQSQALHFLVNAISLETDLLVQSAIFDVFSELKTVEVSQSALDESLRTAVERNKSFSFTIQNQWHDRVAKDQKQIIVQYLTPPTRADQIPSPIPQKLIAKLSLEGYLNYLEAERGPFERLEPNLDVPLRGLARLIPTLLEFGADTTDLSGIYCEDCDFTKSGNLSGVKFDNSYLVRANFSRVDLRNASFKQANLSGTVFFAADLSNADLTTEETESIDWNPGFPLFECANLKGADLSGIPLLVYKEEFSTYYFGERGGSVSVPRMLASQIDNSTKLRSFGIIIVTSVSDAYLLKHPRDATFALFHRDRDNFSENPILEDVWSSGAFRRFTAAFAADEAVYSRTMIIQQHEINSANISRIRPTVKAHLRGFLDQTPLTSIQLLSDFTKALEGSENDYKWKNIKRPPCDDTTVQPHRINLRIESGIRTAQPESKANE